MAEHILIVDDEEPVRRTFHEWLVGDNFDCVIHSAADAQQALTVANQHPIDLAILDWNLGAGSDGLQLLEDLCLFHPDIVAILVTGYADQATPLQAMRMGVRDYLDKNRDLTRGSFLAAVQKQLDRLRPIKRERQLHRGLVAFRSSVEKILPLVRTAAALSDPVPFTDSVRSLFRFLLKATQATDGALVVHSYSEHGQPNEICRAYNIQGEVLDVELLPFAQSLASAVISLQDVAAIADLSAGSQSMRVQLQEFEKGKQHVLAAPLPVSAGLNVVLELFDKSPPEQPGLPVPFTEGDRRLVSAASPFGADMIRQALGERQTQNTLMEAVESALRTSQEMAQTLETRGAAPEPLEALPPHAVLDRMRESLEQGGIGPIEPDQAVRLAELLRTISQNHGREATEYCIEVLQGVDRLLRSLTRES